MIKIAALLVVVCTASLVYQIYTKGWPAMTGQPSKARMETPRAGATASPTPFVQPKSISAPPREIPISGFVFLSGSGSFKTQDRGWIAEGDYYHDWRVLKVLEKGAIFREDTGAEHIVRFWYEEPAEPVSTPANLLTSLKP